MCEGKVLSRSMPFSSPIPCKALQNQAVYLLVRDRIFDDIKAASQDLAKSVPINLKWEVGRGKRV